MKKKTDLKDLKHVNGVTRTPNENDEVINECIDTFYLSISELQGKLNLLQSDINLMNKYSFSPADKQNLLKTESGLGKAFKRIAEIEKELQKKMLLECRIEDLENNKPKFKLNFSSYAFEKFLNNSLKFTLLLFIIKLIINLNN